MVIMIFHWLPFTIYYVPFLHTACCFGYHHRISLVYWTRFVKMQCIIHHAVALCMCFSTRHIPYAIKYSMGLPLPLIAYDKMKYNLRQYNKILYSMQYAIKLLNVKLLLILKVIINICLPLHIRCIPFVCCV